MKARYINPYTDFGFKNIFGEEAGKPLLSKLEVARSAKQMRLSVTDIAKLTGLTEDEIGKL